MNVNMKILRQKTRNMSWVFFRFFKLLIRTRASNYTHLALFSSWIQRQQNLLRVARITTLFLTQMTKPQQLVKGMVQGTSGQGSVASYFFVFSLYSFITRQGLQLTCSWNSGDSWYTGSNTVPSEQSSPINHFFNTFIECLDVAALSLCLHYCRSWGKAVMPNKSVPCPP